jgi:dephospho-CoA kinase
VYRVGVTGGIGSGKTLVCRVFESLGIPVYFADREARRIMDTDAEVRERITRIFGSRAYRKGGLDRQYVAEKAFGDPELLERLNAATHPSVRKDFLAWSDAQGSVPYVIEEAAILFESGADRFMDSVVLVYAPESLRIRRVTERDRVAREDVLRRMQHQGDDRDKIEKSDHVIWNDDSRLLVPQIIQVHEQLVINRKQ